MPTSPKTSRRRADVTEAELIGGVEKRDLVIEDYNPTWQEEYAAHLERIINALGEAASSRTP